MAVKKISPFKLKTLKRQRINFVKCSLIKDIMISKDENLNSIEIVPCYRVRANDGTNRKYAKLEDAQKAFEQLIEFEKRQLTIE